MIEYDSRKWSSQLFLLRGSVGRAVVVRVLAFGAWGAAVVLFHRFVYPAEVPPTVHLLLGVALGLLLVFRTNASYERFWEGRASWGAIVNESRNLARSVFGDLGPGAGYARAVILWTIAFSYACMHSLRGKRELGPIAARLPQDEVALVLAAEHVPTAVAVRISLRLADAQRLGQMSDDRMIAIDQNVQQLIDYIGVCERIQKTPLPFAYVVHLRRALFLYCLTLPFVLVGQFGWSTVLYTVLFTYIICGIEGIGVEIENPFGTDLNDLPLEQICAGIERELLGLMEGRPCAHGVLATLPVRALERDELPA